MNPKYTIDQWTGHLVPIKTGIDMEYYEIGPKEGTPVLMLHGITDGYLSWTQVAPAFAEAGYHCIMPNYRGNGATSCPDCLPEGYTAELLVQDVLALLEQEGYNEPMHVMGHSYGSMMTQLLVQQRPELFKSTILIATCMDCRDVDVITEMVDGTEDVLGVRDFADPIDEDYVREYTTMTNEDKAFCQAVFEHTMAMPAVAWRNLFIGLTRFYNPDIANLPGPLLVLWGTNDVLIPWSEQVKLREALAPKEAKGEVTYVDMPGTGHNGYWDNLQEAENYTRVMLDFVKGHE